MREVALLGGAVTGREATYAGTALRLLRDAGLRVTALRGADDAEVLDLARGAVASGVDAVVVVGGDAVVRAGAEAVLGTSVPLGLVPTGGGDLARSLGVPRGDPRAAVATVLRGRQRAVDLLGVAGRAHVTALSAGFDALVEERADRLGWRSERLARAAASLDGLRRLEPVDYTLDVDGDTMCVEATLVAVAATAPYAGLRPTGGARSDDGLLDVVVLAPMSRRELALAWSRPGAGTLAPRPGDVRRRARRVTVAAPGVVAYADGKRVGPLPVTVDVLTRAVSVFAP